MVVAHELERRLERLSQTPAFENYERVRSEVLRMKKCSSVAGVDRPSHYWTEELAGFEYMLDASPLIIEKLRHHTYHLTGLKVYDYRSNKDEARRRFGYKLDALNELGHTDLLVPESPLLGGFGFEFDSALYNVDTLKFYEFMIGLDKSSVLSRFRNRLGRPTVWEIGGGWGGFAFQFKTLFPNTTYVISDFPEVFLFSAVYLMTAFPDAKIVFCQPEGSEDVLGGESVDFVFVPHTLTDIVRPPRFDLTVNMISFQEMTSEQVDRYARHAFEAGCAYLYSLNRDRSPYNPQLTNVREILARWYELREIAVLPVSYTKLPSEPGKIGKAKPKKLSGREDLDYKHVAGTRRGAP
jgi:hypothetical protein